MINIDDFSNLMKVGLQIGQIVVMLWALKTFLQKPHDTLEERVAVLEARQKDQEESLRRGNNRFDEIARIAEILIRATSALIGFEAHYCESEHKPSSPALDNAKEELDAYLSKIKIL